MKIVDKNSVEGKNIIAMFIKAKGERAQLPYLDDVFGDYDFKQLGRYNACYALVESYIKLCNITSELRRLPVDWGVITHSFNNFCFGAIINCHSKDFSSEEIEYIVISSNNNIIKVC